MHLFQDRDDRLMNSHVYARKSPAKSDRHDLEEAIATEKHLLNSKTIMDLSEG